MAEDLVVVSNRGPVSFRRAEDGRLVGKHGAGGLVSSLAPLVEGSGATWIAAAMNDEDREAARQGINDADGFRFRILDVEPGLYRKAYDVISNGTLWFLSHRLYDLARRPLIDRHWREAWEGYREVNRQFAEAVIDAAPPGATVLVQDYHLYLLAPSVSEARPDLRLVHFTHTPFCDPVDLRILPEETIEELLRAMMSYRACGFHTRRWADAFEACCLETLGDHPATFVSPLAPDAENLVDLASSPECDAAGRRLDAALAGRRMILRVDRIELSKNLLRGFLAFEQLLETHPEWIDRVVFVAFVYPSRQGLAEYLAYRQEVESLAARINRRWSTGEWTPILLDTRDDVPRSVAALQRYDVLLVNPLRDGLNLVAKEGPLVNACDGVLALSCEAGVWDELSSEALKLNPFDVVGTSEVLARALAMPASERARHAKAVRAAAGRRTPRDWLEDQLAAASATG
jgi:trehalose 6-phosphate synthase